MARDPLVIVLAAGEGTRMKSRVTKVLHEILGRPLVGYVLGAVTSLNPHEVVVVVGHQREQVAQYLERDYPDVRIAVQEQQNGTGDAVRCALQAAGESNDRPVVVVAGDTPLLEGETLADLVADHGEQGAAATILTAALPDPTGYGRIIRSDAGAVTRIVEHKDATPEELGVGEINSGMYVFDAAVLERGLAQLTAANAQGELYLTDVIQLAAREGGKVRGSVARNASEVLGVNDRIQLAEARVAIRDRINNELMRNGVSIVDPATTWIEPGALIEADAVIERNTRIDSESVIAAGAVVGPDTDLTKCRVGNGAHVLRSHCIEADIKSTAAVGPFTFLRPGSVVHPGARVGAYVEMKNASVGAGSKVPHLSYVGDADIGEGSNIGAGTVFVNYDGVAKHRTHIGDQVRVGSDSMLVAPVSVGDGSYTAAGSVITEDVPPGAIAFGRARQVNVEGWVEEQRPNTASADAAARAKGTAPGAHGAESTEGD